MTRSLMARRGWAALITATTLLLAACGGGGGSDGGGESTLRLLNVTSDIPSLDLYLNDNKAFSAATTDTLTGYSNVTADGYTVKLTNAGSTTQVFSGAYTLSKDKHYTGIVWGRAGALKFATLPEDDDTDSISANSARVRVYNATSETGSVDVYLTLNDEDLGNITPSAASVATATLGGYKELGVGSYRLRVTGAGNTSDLRLDVTGIQLNLKEYSTIILTAGPGGVLVNAAQLVQRGALTTKKNTLARLRVVAGVQSAGDVAVRLDGQVFTASAPSPRVGTYQRVTAGARLVDVSANGSSVFSESRTLAAGGDYTLLTYGTGQVALISDDNRLPSAGNYRIRLVNGDASAGLTALAVDFETLASDLALGSASVFESRPSSTADRLVEVTSSVIRPAIVFSRNDVKLQSAGVYTIFLLGGSSAPTGVISKDR